MFTSCCNKILPYFHKWVSIHFLFLKYQNHVDIKKSPFKNSGNSWGKGGGGSSKTPLEWKILGGGGCESKSLPWGRYGYFLEPHIHNWTKKWWSWLSKEEIAQFLTETEQRNARLHKTYCLVDVIYFLRRICKKGICLYPETVPSKRPKGRRKSMRSWACYELSNILNE